MNFVSKTVLAVTLMSLAACATEKAIPLQVASVPAAPPPKPRIIAPVRITDAEEDFKKATEALKAGNPDTALLAAKRVAQRYPGTAWYKRSLFLQEQILIQEDWPLEADAAMLRIKAEYPEMADYGQSLLADYHFGKQRFSQAAALYQNLAEQNPRSSLAVRAAFRRGQALLLGSACGAAADALQAFLRENPRSEFAPDAALALAQALLSETRMEEAVQAYRDIWVRYPGTQAEQDAVKTLAWLSASDLAVEDWTAEEWHERGGNLFRTSQYEKTVEAFRKMLAEEPDSQYRAEALFRTGVSHYYLGKRGEAAIVLEKMVKDYPHDQRVPEALYWTGRAYSRLGDRERSTRTFQKLIASHPGSDWADDALFLTGNVYREANDMKKAGLFYRRLYSEYPDSRFADSSIWWIAWAHYNAGDFRKAEAALQELVSRYPRSFLVNQAWYWQGRIEEKAGNTTKAANSYSRVLKHGPYTYYGHRASERLAAIGMPVQSNIDEAAAPMPACPTGEACAEDPLASFEIDDGPPVWTEETRQLLAQEPSFRKTLELMHLDMRKEAAAELWYLQERIPRRRGALIGLSKAFFDLGDYYRSLILVLRNYERYLEGQEAATPADLWLLAYPQGYWDSIVSYSRKYGQDPYFIAAVIREESQFQAEALSPAGARGVMQVMPATGEWIAQNIRLPGFDRSKLFEYDTAINLGTWYIAHLMKRFKGDPLLVAAAYNAGPDAVAGWVGRNGPAERDEFVESIPFSETRGYVKKVLRNYAEYRRIYGKTVQAVQAIPVGNGQSKSSLISEDSAMKPPEGASIEETKRP